MKIREKSFVEIQYVLTLDSKEEVDRSDPNKPLSFIFGTNQIVPGLEKKLEGMESGYKGTLVVAPEEAYGEHNPDLIRELPRQNFPDDMEIQSGMVFQANTPHGLTNFMIQEVSDDTIKGDFNHPLAGQNLNFEVEVVSVRDATEEEITAATACHSECSPSCCSGCEGESTCDDSKKPK